MITRLANSSLAQDLPKYRSMLAGNSAYDPGAFVSIASATGTGSSGAITFSSISGTYQHLQLRVIVRDTQATTLRNMTMTLNNVTTASYADHSLFGTGVAVGVGGGGASVSNIGPMIFPASSATANVHSVWIIDIHDYASTSKNKTVRIFGGYDENGTGRSELRSAFLNSTSAITRIDFATNGTGFTTSSTFALYGIKGA